MKTIALSQSLGQLKDGLEGLGYLVVFDHEIQSLVDVYIYNNEESQRSLYSANQILSSVTTYSQSDTTQHSGTLLINGKGKSLEDIQHIIQHRVYSPIF